MVAAEAKDYTILVMPKLVGIPYFNASEAGALKAGEDLGVNVIYAGPNQADAAAQVRMIEDYISRRRRCHLCGTYTILQP